MWAVCGGLFSEQCNSNGTRLQCRAAYHPVSPVMNINQKAHSYRRTDGRVCAWEATQLKSTYFWTGRNISSTDVWWRKMFRQEKYQSRKEQPEESQACNRWLGRLSGQGDILAASPFFLSAHSKTLLFVDCRPTFPARLPLQRPGWNARLADTWHESVSKWTQVHTNQTKDPVLTVYCQSPAALLQIYKNTRAVPRQRHFP